MHRLAVLTSCYFSKLVILSQYLLYFFVNITNIFCYEDDNAYLCSTYNGCPSRTVTTGDLRRQKTKQAGDSKTVAARHTSLHPWKYRTIRCATIPRVIVLCACKMPIDTIILTAVWLNTQDARHLRATLRPYVAASLNVPTTQYVMRMG